jgi:hypothetical protein
LDFAKAFQTGLQKEYELGMMTVVQKDVIEVDVTAGWTEL